MPDKVVALPSARSHNWTIPSSDPEASIVPSGENATEWTPSPRSENSFIFLFFTSHSLTRPLARPTARVVSSVIATERTGDKAMMRVSVFPVAGFHKRTVLSADPVASRVPSGEKSTERTAFL